MYERYVDAYEGNIVSYFGSLPAYGGRLEEVIIIAITPHQVNEALSKSVIADLRLTPIHKIQLIAPTTISAYILLNSHQLSEEGIIKLLPTVTNSRNRCNWSGWLSRSLPPSSPRVRCC